MGGYKEDKKKGDGGARKKNNLGCNTPQTGPGGGFQVKEKFRELRGGKYTFTK